MLMLLPNPEKKFSQEKVPDFKIFPLETWQPKRSKFDCVLKTFFIFVLGQPLSEAEKDEDHGPSLKGIYI